MVHAPMMHPIRTLLVNLHFPFSESVGVRAWNARTVPVGKRLARLPALFRAFWCLELRDNEASSSGCVSEEQEDCWACLLGLGSNWSWLRRGAEFM